MSEVKPVTEAEQFAHDAAVIARINAVERRRRITNAGRWAVMVVCIPVAASGWVAWAKYPLTQQVVRFIPTAEDGSPLLALRDDELPPEDRKRHIQNSVINYVLWREGFNDLEADKNYIIVSALSSPKVRDEYQSIDDPNKPGSHWKTYSGGGWIKTSYDSMEGLAPPTGYANVPPAYLVRFCRQVKFKNKNAPERAELWGATVGFKSGVPGYDPRIIAAYNPGMIQVTDYPSVRPIGPIGNNNENARGSGCSVTR